MGTEDSSRIVSGIPGAVQSRWLSRLIYSIPMKGVRVLVAHPRRDD